MKKKIYIGIILLLITIIGVTFAFMQYNKTGEKNELLLGEIYMHYNTSRMISLDNAIPRKDKDDNVYIEFSIDGLNNYKESDIWYGIDLVYGEIPDGKLASNRIRDDLLRFTLTKQIDDNEEEIVINNQGYLSIDDLRMYVETIPKDSNSETVHTYRLYVWITKEIRVGNAPQVDYTIEEWNNLFANVKVKVVGDFVEKEKEDVIKVTFDANGGTVSPGFKYYHEGDTYGELPTPTRDGYTFMGWNYSPLPSEYQKVKYLESTGTQYIDTGVVPDINTQVDYKIRFSQYSSPSSPLIGARVGDTYSNRFFPIAYASYNTEFRTAFGIKELIISNIDFNIDYEGSFQPQNEVSIINGTSYSLANNDFVKKDENNLYLFATSGYGSDLHLANGKIYYCKIYQNNILVRILVPCYRKSDNVAGLYDTVNNVFYTNEGTGKFTVGNDIALADSNYAIQITSNSIVDIKEDHTLYAEWQYNPKVTFDANGGTVSTETKMVTVGSTYGILPTPIREGYTFKGWNGKNKFNKVDYAIIDNRVYFSTKNLIYGNTYTFSSNLKIEWFKISSDSNGYNSVSQSDFQNGFNSFSFRMQRNINIPENRIQYIIISDDNYNLPNNINYYDSFNIQIEEGNKATPYEPYYITSDTTVVQEKDHTLKAIWEPVS